MYQSFPGFTKDKFFDKIKTKNSLAHVAAATD